MNHLKSKILIFLILLLAFLLRIYLLDKIPNSISADEAAFGYNAYSILKNGRDEFGIKFPLLFRSFDDHKNPVFVYILVPFIRLFGLNEWAIRLPSMIFGLGLVLISYLLIKELTQNTRLSLIGCFFTAISPWLIQYSRISLEIITAVFFSLLGTFLFLKSRKHPFILVFSIISFSLAFWTYYSNKLWVLLFIPALILFNKKISRSLIISLIILIILLIPYFNLYRTSNILLRQYGISVFSDETEKYKNSEFILTDVQQNFILGKLIHNRRLVFLNQTIDGYLRILNPEIFFSRNHYNQISSTRLFYLWQIPLLLIGTYYLVSRRRLFLLMIYWLFVGFLPGAITYFPPFDRRILINSFPLIFIASYGFTTITKLIKFRHKVNIFAILLIVSSFYLYLHQYFVHGKDQVVELWGNGMKNLVLLTSQEKVNYENVIVSIKLNQPLTFFLFFEKYDPVKYLAEGGTVSGGYLDERSKFDKYQFKNIIPDNLSKKNLYVWDAHEQQPCLKAIYSVKRSNNSPLGFIGTYSPDTQDCQQWLTGSKI